ncbi:MAG TPA: ATP-binding protein [Bacteroidales bacterium]|nr:ATP-binding protein [Bacteroidales bacterium]
MFYPRKIFSELTDHLDKRQITVITGMRRTGKTTLAIELLRQAKDTNQIFIDLERFDNRELFTDPNYDNIIRQLTGRGLDFTRKAWIVLDEIQLVPHITSVLKYLYDHYPIKFIVTGSSSFYLKNLFSESLAGRKILFELYPLSFGEFLNFRGEHSGFSIFPGPPFDIHQYNTLSALYNEFIDFGGFPEVVLASGNEEKMDILNDILHSYMSIDIKQLADFRKDRELYNLLKLLGSRCGSRLDVSKLSLVSGISRPAVSNYLDFFEKTFLISRINVFTRSRDREIVKAQKIYFADNGILTLLSQISSGTKFENAIYNQLRGMGKLQYYALKTGREIDFILNENVALEIKERPGPVDIKSLQRLAHLAGIERSMLIGRYPVPGFKEYIWGGGIR